MTRVQLITGAADGSFAEHAASVGDQRGLAQAGRVVAAEGTLPIALIVVVAAASGGGGTR